MDKYWLNRKVTPELLQAAGFKEYPDLREAVYTTAGIKISVRCDRSGYGFHAIEIFDVHNDTWLKYDSFGGSLCLDRLIPLMRFMDLHLAAHKLVMAAIAEAEAE